MEEDYKLLHEKKVTVVTNGIAQARRGQTSISLRLEGRLKEETVTHVILESMRSLDTHMHDNDHIKSPLGYISKREIVALYES